MAHPSPKILTDCAAGILRKPLKGAMVVFLSHVTTMLESRGFYDKIRYILINMKRTGNAREIDTRRSLCIKLGARGG